MKKFLVFVLAVMLCLSAVACSGGQSGSNDSGSNSSSSSDSNDSNGSDSNSNSSDSNSSDSGSNAAEGGTIVFYGFSDWIDTDPWKAGYEAAKAKFEEENPGFTVELQSDPWGDWEPKYKTMFASGNAADVFMVNNPDFPNFANSGNLLDMDKYAGADFFNLYLPGVMDMYRWQGVDMSMPFSTDCRILWYNKDIFKEAGLDPEKPPTTWAELVAAAKQIEEKTDKYGFGMDLGLHEFPAQSLYCASKGSVIEVADDGTITPTVNTPEFKGYLQTLLDMKSTFEPDYTVLDHHDVAKQFTEGQMGIIIGAMLGEETDIYTKDWYGQALVPSIDGSTNGSFGGGFGISVSNNTKYPEQAVKFAQILTSPEFCSKEISAIPASEEGIAQSEAASDPKNAVIFDQIKYARQGQPKTLYYAEIDSAVYDAVSEVLVGGKSIDEAIKNLETAINDIVK